MDRDQRLFKFRLRLLGAFGLGMLPGLLYNAEAEAGHESKRCDALAEGETDCLSADMPSQVMSRLNEDSGETGGHFGCGEGMVSALIDGEEGECCYSIDGCDDGNDDCNGCYGRPYIAEAEVISAPTIRNPAWGPTAAPELVPELANLCPDQRAALVEFWSDNARAEHSSVAGFHRFSLDLIAHGAPPELLERSLRATADELSHARVCYALASHYAGEPLGPGPMPLGSSAPIAASLLELAVATAREGCLAETSAAWLADEMAATATDPAVRAALQQIAREEGEHAELAWMTLRWAIEVGGAEVREAVAEVFANARPAQLGGGAMRVPDHGLLAGAEVQAIANRGFREILIPVMQAALAA